MHRPDKDLFLARLSRRFAAFSNSAKNEYFSLRIFRKNKYFQIALSISLGPTVSVVVSDKNRQTHKQNINKRADCQKFCKETVAKYLHTTSQHIMGYLKFCNFEMAWLRGFQKILFYHCLDIFFANIFTK